MTEEEKMCIEILLREINFSLLLLPNYVKAGNEIGVEYIRKNSDAIKNRLNSMREDFYDMLNKVKEYVPQVLVANCRLKYDSLEEKAYSGLGLTKLNQENKR